MSVAWKYILGIAGAAIAPILLIMQWQSSPADRNSASDLGVYYRVTAEYTYKGEPLTLDFGVSCGSIWKNPKQAKYSMDVFAGPALYGVRTRDGKVVAVSTRSYCDDLRPKEPNAGAPDDFLPITIVYDDPETLYHGVAYASDEAYHNAYSTLTEPKVRITRVNRVELTEFKRREVPNAVKSRRNDGELGRLSQGKKHAITGYCRGWARIPMTEIGREVLRKYWPEEKPRFWWPPSSEAYNAFWLARTGPTAMTQWSGFGDRTSGLFRVNGQGARYYARGKKSVPAFYPEVVDVSRLNWNSTEFSWNGTLSVDVKIATDAHRGFLSCHPNIPATAPLPREAAHEKAKKNYRSRFMSTGWSYRAELITFGELSVAGAAEVPSGYQSDVVLENDEYIWFQSPLSFANAGEQGDE